MTTKKKIGIVTFWKSNDNYGQQLQGWALQEFLRQRGFYPYLIREDDVTFQKVSIKKKVKQICKRILSKILYATHLAYNPLVYDFFSFCLDKEACRRRFPTFRKKRLSMSKIYASVDEIITNPPQADIYITGSDQVWNCDIPPQKWKYYFLQFGADDAKRIAYAPSMANRIDLENRMSELKAYLTSFDAISVRESIMVDLCQQLGFNASLVVDPSLLLNVYDYRTLYKEKKKTNNEIFIYSLNYTYEEELPITVIKKYAKENSLQIIVTPSSGYVTNDKILEDVTYKYLSIEMWLNQIDKSCLVVTASFHGIVFSIIYHKPFIYTPLIGELSMSNNRIYDLLNMLHLNSRIWNPERTIESYDKDIIDWANVDIILNKLRNDSYSFLDDALSLI